MRDIAIAYRIYPGISKVPGYHETDKFQLSKFCLQSFKRAVGGLSFKIWALLDGCPPEYAELFSSIFSDDEMEIIETPCLGNLKTFSMQVDLLTQQDEAELVYFAEDDYFYFPGALAEMVDFARGNAKVDFVTPYDHPDNYLTSTRYERHRLVTFGSRHWRTASSTCLTFLTRRSTLRATQDIMRSYSRGNMDCSLWLSLTQRAELFDPRVHAADEIRVKIWGKAWIWGWRNILSSRAYRLWSPLPTLATHMEVTGLSPLVDWPSEFALAEKQFPSSREE